MHRRRRARVFRHVRRSLSFALVLLAITAVLPAVPALAGVLSPLSDTVSSADPAHASYQKASTPPPLTDAQRLPVVDLSGLPGIWPNDVVAAYPGDIAPTSPAAAVAGDRPLPAAGAPGFDAFADGTTRNPRGRGQRSGGRDGLREHPPGASVACATAYSSGHADGTAGANDGPGLPSRSCHSSTERSLCRGVSL